MRLLILRPQPGAAATAARAAEFGLKTVVAPLFAVRPLTWSPPDPALFDALVMTSANAARHGGPALALYRKLPLHAVGRETARAARAAGFLDVGEGSGDVDALLAVLAPGAHRRLLHLCGEHRRVPAIARAITAVPVYTAQAVNALPAIAADTARNGAVAMLHSMRAAGLFGALLNAAEIGRNKVAVVAISAAAAGGAGGGWREVAIAPAPTDAAMLAIARILCDNRPP